MNEITPYYTKRDIFRRFIRNMQVDMFVSYGAILAATGLNPASPDNRPAFYAARTDCRDEDGIVLKVAYKAGFRRLPDTKIIEEQIPMRKKKIRSQAYMAVQELLAVKSLEALSPALQRSCLANQAIFGTILGATSREAQAALESDRKFNPTPLTHDYAAVARAAQQCT